MDAYVFSTDHAGEYPPYLLVPEQNSATPGHPDGKSWVPWKPVNLGQTPAAGDAESVAAAIENDGFHITSSKIFG